jgi:hypothetical protein
MCTGPHFSGRALILTLSLLALCAAAAATSHSHDLRLTGGECALCQVAPTGSEAPLAAALAAYAAVLVSWTPKASPGVASGLSNAHLPASPRGPPASILR